MAIKLEFAERMVKIWLRNIKRARDDRRVELTRERIAYIASHREVLIHCFVFEKVGDFEVVRDTLQKLFQLEPVGEESWLVRECEDDSESSR